MNRPNNPREDPRVEDAQRHYSAIHGEKIPVSPEEMELEDRHTVDSGGEGQYDGSGQESYEPVEGQDYHSTEGSLDDSEALDQFSALFGGDRP